MRAASHAARRRRHQPKDLVLANSDRCAQTATCADARLSSSSLAPGNTHRPTSVYPLTFSPSPSHTRSSLLLFLSQVDLVLFENGPVLPVTRSRHLPVHDLPLQSLSRPLSSADTFVEQKLCPSPSCLRLPCLLPILDTCLISSAS